MAAPACNDLGVPAPDTEASWREIFGNNTNASPPEGSAGGGKLRTNWEVHDALRSARFCLQPAGDTPTRSQIFECLLCGGIPVFFSTCAQADLVYERLYEPFLPPFERTAFGPGPWAVVLDEERVINNQTYLLGTLANIAADKLRITKMQETIISFLPRLQYPPDPTAPPDLPRYGPDALGVYNALLSERLSSNAERSNGEGRRR